MSKLSIWCYFVGPLPFQYRQEKRLAANQKQSLAHLYCLTNYQRTYYMSTLIPWDPLDVCLESPSKHVYQTVHFISQTFLNQFDLV